MPIRLLTATAVLSLIVFTALLLTPRPSPAQRLACARVARAAQCVHASARGRRPGKRHRAAHAKRPARAKHGRAGKPARRPSVAAPTAPPQAGCEAQDGEPCTFDSEGSAATAEGSCEACEAPAGEESAAASEESAS